MGTLKRKFDLLGIEEDMRRRVKDVSRGYYGRRRRRYPKAKRRRIVRRRYRRRRSTLSMKRRAIPETKKISTSTDYSSGVRAFGLTAGAASGHQHFTYDGANGNNQWFPAITKGLNVDNRIADKVLLTSMRSIIRVSGSGSHVNQMQYRIIIYRKKTQTTNANAISDILHFDPFSTVSYSVASRRKEDTYRTYIIHYDRTFKAPAETVPGGNFQRDHKIVLKLGHTLMFDDTSAVNGTEYGDLALILLANFGDTAAATALRAQIQSTLYFVDP